MSASRPAAQDQAYATFRVSQTGFSSEKLNPDTQVRDGGFIWCFENDVYLGIYKASTTPDVDTFLQMGRNPSNGLQYFQLQLQQDPTTGANAPVLYANNSNTYHAGLRAPNGQLTSGFQYDGDNGNMNIRGVNVAQVLSPQGTSFRPIIASAFTVGCSAETKEDFAALPDSALSVLRSAPITRWRRQGDHDDEQMHVGPVAETLRGGCSARGAARRPTP